MKEGQAQTSELPVRVRFEQRRGHYLIVEGAEDRPLTLAQCDAFQLRMLAANAVPGLLKLEFEQCDDCLSLRYALSGTRMLSQALRTQKWTMATFIGAVNRLAEVMEDCRLYVLEPENLLLESDRIFIGERGETDVRFIYLPLPSASGSLAKKLESLLVRWMMHTEKLDGDTVQRLLQLIASPDFKPVALVRFTRQYLAEQSAGNGTYGMAAAAASQFEPSGVRRADEGKQSGEMDELPPDDIPQSHAAGWRWFAPPAADAQRASALLGNGPEEAFDEAPEGPDEPQDAGGRRNVWLVCSVVAILAVVWRWGYAANPGTVGLAVSIAATIAVVAAAIWLWLTGKRSAQRPVQQAEMAVLEQASSMKRQAAVLVPEHRELVHATSAPDKPIHIDNDGKIPIFANMQTERLNWAADYTEQLAQETPSFVHAMYYLLWETDPQTTQVPLHASSIIIGRSREASGHVDESPGISRVHLELRHTDNRWIATDLGSRNGTKLNGEPMVAYESYDLQPEACLDLAGSRYRFKYGKTNALAGNVP